ncbi:VOC family protein [Bacillus velezensis]|uniref:hypothetical protein n=1 Tax=Bacillus velezensis TaxID=492670 RepID=UPI0021B5EEF6|nr:hypothetical protein [Bacillus velezensis]
MTRLKRIEVVPSLKAETSLVVHDKQAIANMQPELSLHTPSMMCFRQILNITAVILSTCLRAGYLPLRHREKNKDS